MPDIKTKPVTATHLPEKAEFRNPYGVGLVPGGFRVTEPILDETGCKEFWYCCPCGCGAISPLLVGVGAKPIESPSWKWNGSLEKPTLEPSVHHVGHWHGYLTDGVWISC